MVADIEGGHRLMLADIRVLRRKCGPKRDEVIGESRNNKMGSLMICTPHPILFG